MTSSSTDTEVFAAYDDNASYDVEGSAAKAKMFIVACRILLRRLPKRSSGGQNSEEIELTPEQLRAEIRDAKAWLAAASDALTGAGVVRPDFTDFRRY